MAEDIIFEGGFDLQRALSDFQSFLGKIGAGIDNINKKQTAGSDATAKASQAQERLNAEYEKQKRKLKELEQAGEKYVNNSLTKINEAVDKGLISEQRANSARDRAEAKLNALRKAVQNVSIAVEHNGKATNGNIVSLKRIIARYDQLEDTLQRNERQLAKSSLNMTELDKRADRFFKGLVVGGFALQQFGGALNIYLTQPLLRAVKAVGESVLKFDDFEETLRVIGNRTPQEIKKAYDVIREVARQPNIELEQTLDLFTKVTEASKGLVSDTQFREIGLGLSRVLGSIEPSERRGFFGQLTDILSGGEASNIDKTLAGVPRLKVAYNEIQEAAGGALTQQEAVLRAFQQLSTEPAIDGLRNKLKNLRDNILLFGKRLGDLYKDRIERTVVFIEERMYPIIDKTIKRIEQSPFLQNLLAGATAFLAVLAPLAFTLGTVAVVGAGIRSLFTGIAGSFGFAAKKGLELKIATDGLTTLMTPIASKTGMLSRIAGFLPRILSFLNPVTLAITALVTAVILIVKASDEAQESLKGLLDNLSSGAVAIFNNIIGLVKDLASLIVSVFNDIGSFLTDIGVTDVLGSLVSTLIQILDVVLQLVVVLSGSMVLALRFIVDILNDGLTVAIEKLEKRFVDIIPKFLLDLLGIERASLKAKVGIEELSEEQEEANKKTAEFQKTISDLSSALEKQNKVLGENIKKLREQKQAHISAIIGTIRGIESSRAGRIISGTDFTDSVSVTQSRSALGIQNQNALKSAAEEDAREYGKRASEAFEAFIKELDRIVEGNKNKPSVKKAIEDFKLKLYEGVVTDRDVIATSVKASSDIESLEGRQAFATAFQRLLFSHLQTMKAIQNLQTKTFQVRSENLDAEREFNEKLLEAQKEEDKNKDIYSLDKKSSDMEDELEASNRRVDIAEEEYEKTGQFNFFIRRINDEMIVQRNLLKQQLIIQRDIDLLNAKTKAERDLIKKRFQDDLERGTDGSLPERLTGFYKSFTQAEEAIKELTKDLLAELRENDKALVELEIELTRRGGGSTSKFAELLENATDVSDDTEDILDNLRRLSKIISDAGHGFITAKGTDVDEFVNGFHTLRNGLAAVIENTKIDDTKSLEEFIKQASLLLDILSSNDFDRLDDSSKASLLSLITNIGLSIEKAKETVDKLNDSTEYRIVKQKELALATEEAQLSELKHERELLDIAKQILAERRKKTPSTLGGIFDAVLGGNKKKNEEERELLELEAEILQSELEIALLRLEIEKEILILRAEGDTERIQKIEELFKKETQHIKERAGLEDILLRERIANIGSSDSLKSIISESIGDLLSGIFKKKDKNPAVTKEEADETEKSVNSQLTSVGKLQGGLLKTVKVIDAVGDAFLNMEEISVQAVLKTVKAALDAIAKEALVNSLKFAAIALSALVFGDFGTAARAGTASLGWAAVAGIAKLGSSLLGLGIQDEEQATANTANSRAGVSDDDETNRNIIRQKANSIYINFDIRHDDGIIIEKYVKAVNANTEVTTLTANSQTGFAFPPV